MSPVHVRRSGGFRSVPERRRCRSPNTTVPGGALALRAATRNYRAGAEGSLAFELPRRWHLAVTVDGRFGRDALVDGVYTRQTTAALRVGRRTRGDGYWTAVFVVPFAERGLRSSSVEEAFMLRGSNYYNPRMRSSGGRCA